MCFLQKVCYKDLQKYECAKANNIYVIIIKNRLPTVNYVGSFLFFVNTVLTLQTLLFENDHSIIEIGC